MGLKLAEKRKSHARVSYQRQLSALVLAVICGLACASTAWARVDVCDEFLAAAKLDPSPYALNGLRLMDLFRAHSRERLKVATWNLNLLDRNYALTRVKAPLYDERLAKMYGWLREYLVSQQAPDVLMLQEVWTREAHETVLAVARDLGFTPAQTDSRSLLRHGMQILVRSSAVGRIEGRGFIGFSQSRYSPGFEVAGRIWRGLMYINVTLKDGQTVSLGTVHLTPFARFARARSRQIDELSEALSRARVGRDHVVVGGDFNIAADYASEGAGVLQPVRWQYGYLRRMTGLRDTFRSVEPDDPGYTLNTTFPRLKAARAATLADQRLDYIFAAENAEGVGLAVRDAGVRFKEAIDGLFPSDHYLVSSDLEFFRRRQPSAKGH